MNNMPKGGAAGAGMGSDDLPTPPSTGSQDADTGVPSLFGVWQAASGALTFELILNSDGSYQFTTRVLTSTVSADEEDEKGTFVISDTTLSFTPTERSCNDALTPTTDGYAFDGSVLVLGAATGNLTFARAASPLSSDGLALVVGCGSPFAPVANQGHEPKPSTPGTSPLPYGSWLTGANGVYFELTLGDDNSYELSVFIPTSTVTADEYIQKGTFGFNQAIIYFIPSEASCPGAVPAWGDAYIYNNAGLVTKDASGNVVGWAKTDSKLDTGFTTVLGCSINNGPWTPFPIAPVSN